MLRLIEELAKDGLTADELQRAKTSWRSSWLRAQQGNAGLADSYSWNELNGNGYTHFERLPAMITAITDKDIRRAAKTYLSKARAIVVRVMPKAK